MANSRYGCRVGARRAEGCSKPPSGALSCDGCGKADSASGVSSAPALGPAFSAIEAPLTVERVEFGAGRMTLLVRMAPHASDTTPQLLQQLLPLYPDLPHHACVNGEGPRFDAVMDHTSVAHLLEHMLISQQLRQLPDAGSASVLCGATTWVSRAEGRARIEVGFVDDLIALGALRNCLDALSACMV